MRINSISSVLKYDEVKNIFYFDSGCFNVGLKEMEYLDIQDEEGNFNLNKYLMRFVDKDVDFFIHADDTKDEPLVEMSMEDVKNKILKEIAIKYPDKISASLVADYLNIEYMQAHEAILQLVDEGELYFDE